MLVSLIFVYLELRHMDIYREQCSKIHRYLWLKRQQRKKFFLNSIKGKKAHKILINCEEVINLLDAYTFQFDLL